MSALDQLLLISSPSLGDARLPDSIPMLASFGAVGSELEELLRRRNGFYAFESALHVFPWGAETTQLGLASWNAPNLWRAACGDLAEGCLFFAEDVFGVQFCFHAGGVFTFDPETGARMPMGASLEEWASLILVDHRTATGWPIAHDWQAAHGPLRPGHRLAPKQPFVLGGAFDLDNLYEAEVVDRMRFCAQLAGEIRNLPDGSRIRLVAKD